MTIIDDVMHQTNGEDFEQGKFEDLERTLQKTRVFLAKLTDLLIVNKIIEIKDLLED